MGFYNGLDVAVIGGAGMIGSHLVELLLKEDARVTVIDNLSRGRLKNVRFPVGYGMTWINTDVTRPDFAAGMRKHDVVFNLAAKVTGMHYNRNHHATMFMNNMLLQIVPLQAAIAAQVPFYLDCSTVCVYPHDMSYPVKEEEGHDGEPESTNAGYGWAKRMGERLALWAHEEFGIQVAITRFSNAYGPRDYFDPRTSHVIPALIKRTLEEDPVVVYGTGKQIREFLYAEDAAKGCMKVLENYSECDPVNIGSPRNRVSIRELAQLIQEACGVQKELVFDTSIPDGYPKRGSNIDLLKQVTGWEPEVDLPEGLRRTVEWYQENQGIA